MASEAQEYGILALLLPSFVESPSLVVPVYFYDMGITVLIVISNETALAKVLCKP